MAAVLLPSRSRMRRFEELWQLLLKPNEPCNHIPVWSVSWLKIINCGNIHAWKLIKCLPKRGLWQKLRDVYDHRQCHNNWVWLLGEIVPFTCPQTFTMLTPVLLAWAGQTIKFCSFDFLVVLCLELWKLYIKQVRCQMGLEYGWYLTWNLISSSKGLKGSNCLMSRFNMRTVKKDTTKKWERWLFEM